MIEVNVVGAQGIHEMLREYTDPNLTKRAQRATKAGAKVLAAPLRNAVTPLSKRMGASVYIHVAKRDKPAYVVGHHQRIAFFWHFVIGGTKAHSTSARNGSRPGPYVRGVPPHPVVAMIADQYATQVYQAIAADLAKDS